MRAPKEYVKSFQQKARLLLVGKTVKAISYLPESDRDKIMWPHSPLVIEFTDGTVLFAQSDPEGNDAGTLCCLPPGQEEVHFVPV